MTPEEEKQAIENEYLCATMNMNTLIHSLQNAYSRLMKAIKMKETGRFDSTNQTDIPSSQSYPIPNKNNIPLSWNEKYTIKPLTDITITEGSFTPLMNTCPNCHSTLIYGIPGSITCPNKCRLF